jgi:tetratricopeptide (TPR) repeat protein
MTAMKKISKFRFITTVLLMTLLLFIGITNAAENKDIRQLKEAQQLDKVNHTGKNIYMNFKKSIIEESFIKKLESVSQIESFINDVAVSGLSLYNVPKLSKSLANKIKQFVVLGNITPAKGDELVRKLKDMQRSNLKRDCVYLCGECGEDCDLAKFITANIGESYETTTISANDSTNKTFLKSQDAIVQNDYANMVQSFDVCLAEINRLITKMPDVKSCKCDNEECYFTYSTLYLEYLFLKKYITIQKGYFLLKNGKYSEAETYFRSQATPSTVAVSKISLAAEKKAMIKWNEEALKMTLTHFIGRCLYEQGKYSEALKYFSNITFVNIPRPPSLLFGDINDILAMFEMYPYSGLYSDFALSGDNAERGKQIGKSFSWLWQTFYFSGIANYKLGNKKDALAFLKVYISGHDKEFEKEAKKLIAELETEPNIPAPVEISEIKFLRSDGTEVKWGDILESEKTYIIQAITKMPCSEATLKIKYHSDYTKPQAEEWILSKKSNSNDKIFEYKTLIDLKIVGAIVDSKKTFMTLDFVKDSNNSSFEDSKEFTNQCIQQGYLNYGTFRAQKGMIVASENIAAPILPNSIDAMKYAGIEYLKLECGSICRLIPFACQADLLYFSGHGIMKTGNLIIDADKNDKDIYLTPEMIDKWTSNIKVVIFAGCSVLNMKQYYQYENMVLNPYDLPGKKWVNKGPLLFLGYRHKAPKDFQDDSNYTQKIVKKFFDKYKSCMNYRLSWMMAHLSKDKKGKNACAIDLINKTYFFYRCATLIPDDSGGGIAVKRYYIPDQENYE